MIALFLSEYSLINSTVKSFLAFYWVNSGGFYHSQPELRLSGQSAVVVDGMVDGLNVVDVFEADGGVMGGGGIDEDIAAVEDLLDQGSLVADAADFGKADGFVVFAEDAAAGGDFFVSDVVVLGFAKVDCVGDFHRDHQDVQEDSDSECRLVEFAVAAECPHDSGYGHGQECRADSSGDDKAEDIPGRRDQKQRAVAFAVKDGVVHA